MARSGRRHQERGPQQSPAVVVTTEDGVPSLMSRLQQEDALQEDVVDPDLAEFQQSLDTDGIDPEDTRDMWDPAKFAPADVTEALQGLVGEVQPPPAHPVLSEQQLRSEEKLDVRAPMSDDGVRAVQELLDRRAARDVRPRMAQERLEMRIRIPERWQRTHPKRPDTIAYENWKLYVDGMTVSAYLASHDRRRARMDLQWDIDHEFVYLQTPQEYAAEVVAAAAAQPPVSDED